MSRYRKVLVAAIAATTAAVAGGVLPAPYDGWAQVVLAVAGVYGVYQAPNDAPTGELPDPAVSERG